MPYHSLVPEQPLPPLPRPQGQDQPSIVYYAAPTIAYNFVPHYKRNASAGLGSIQCILASISMTGGVMAIVCGAGCYKIGIGIWAGVWYLISGYYAIAAGKKPTNKLIILTLVFSVFGILFGITQLTITSIGVTYELHCYEYYSYYDTNYYGTCVDSWKGAVVANSMMIGVGSLEIIIGVCITAISSQAISEGSKLQFREQFAYFATIPVTFAPNQHEPVHIQRLPPSSSSSPSPPPPPPPPPHLPPARESPPPAYESQPPPSYDQVQHSSRSTRQQRMYVGVQHDLLTSL